MQDKSRCKCSYFRAISIVLLSVTDSDHTNTNLSELLLVVTSQVIVLQEVVNKASFTVD